MDDGSPAQSDCSSVLERTMIGLPDLRLFRSVQSRCKAHGDQRTAYLFDHPMSYIALFVLSVRAADLRQKDHGISHADGAMSRRRQTLSYLSNHYHHRGSRLSVIISFPHNILFTPSTTTRIVQSVVDGSESTPSNIARAEASCPERTVPSIDNRTRESSLISSSRQDSTRQSSNLRLGK